VSFRSILRELVENCSGGVGAILMSSDGIPIDEYVAADRVPEGPLRDEFGTAGVEFGRILEEIRKAADALSAGALEETVVSLANMVLVFRPVDEEIFLAVVVLPEGNLGKARYLARRHLLELRQEL